MSESSPKSSKKPGWLYDRVVVDGGGGGGGSVTQVLRQATRLRRRSGMQRSLSLGARSDGVKTGFESVSWTWER